MLGAEDVVNQVLDALGVPERAIGSFADGTTESEVARRLYGPTLRQLLRGAHWAFARGRGKLQLLADRFAPADCEPPLSRAVEYPWRYAYAWPIDGVQGRWLPWRPRQVAVGNYVAPPWPEGEPFRAFAQEQPARFLVSSSREFPVVVGEAGWDGLPDLDGIEGVGLTSRRIVLTDVPDAEFVYTRLVLDPHEWDSLFRQAIVAALAERFAFAVIADKKLAAALRAQQIAAARQALGDARAASANETGFPLTADHTPDWLRARRQGYRALGAVGELPGYFRCGWEALGFSDGSVF